MATSDDLRQIFTAGRPLIEEWLDIGERIAALRDVAASKGLDWSQLKALMKAQIQDERDETGNGKRVARIVEKAEFASAYADMLGLANMNEKNFSEASQSYAEVKGADPKLIETVVKGVQTEIGRKALITALDAMIDAETGEITEHEQPETDTNPAGSAARGQAALSGECPEAPSMDEAQSLVTSDQHVEANAEGPSRTAATIPNPPAPSSQDTADKTGEVVPPPASPVELCDADVPAFLKKGKTDKPDCLKLKDGHCKIGFATPALCSTCNHARMARAT